MNPLRVGLHEANVVVKNHVRKGVRAMIRDLKADDLDAVSGGASRIEAIIAAILLTHRIDALLSEQDPPPAPVPMTL